MDNSYFTEYLFVTPFFWEPFQRLIGNQGVGTQICLKLTGRETFIQKIYFVALLGMLFLFNLQSSLSKDSSFWHRLRPHRCLPGQTGDIWQKHKYFNDQTDFEICFFSSENYILQIVLDRGQIQENCLEVKEN